MSSVEEYEKYLRGFSSIGKKESSNVIDSNKSNNINVSDNDNDNYNPLNIINKIISSNFDSSVFDNVDDSDLPLAKNWLEFCNDKKFLGLKPFPKQIKFGLEFFADYCPDCTDPNIMGDLFNQPIQEIYDRVQLLEYGKCPKCGKTRQDLVNEGKLNFYNELAGCAGQRGGKCLTYDTFILTEDGVMQIGEYCKPQYSVGFNNIDLKVFNGNKLTKAKYFYKTKKEIVHKIDLGSISIKGRGSHPIKTYYGFTLLKDLKIGTPVEIHYGQNIWGNKIPSFDKLGYPLISNSVTKEIPLLIRQAPKSFVVEFLKSLFEDDGGIESNNKITYTTISKNLVNQLSIILLNLGIPHKVRCKYTWDKKGSAKQIKKKAYILTIIGKYMEVFQKEIGFSSNRKNNLLKKAIKAFFNRKYHVPFFYDKLPKVVKKEFLNFIKDIKNEIRYYWQEPTDRYGFLTLVNNYDIFKRLQYNNVCLTKQKVMFLINCIYSSEYKNRFSESILKKAKYFEYLCTNNSYWTYVKNKKIENEELMYDFNIPDKHQFWTNGIISHNSVFVAMCANYQLHRFLKLPNPSYYFNLLKNQALHMTFVAITYKQADDTLWQPFRAFFDSSPWFNAYNELLDYYASKYSTRMYVKKDTFILYDHKKLTCYASGPDKRKLRGTTRFFSSVDELGWFHGTDKAVKLNADEVCKALERSLRTVRSASNNKRKILNEYNAPDALFVNISSPSAVNDKIMRLVKEHAPNRYIFHLPTWEMNPTITREDLDTEYRSDPINSERDYGANPPLSDTPFISNPEIVKAVIRDKRKNGCKYKLYHKTDRLGNKTINIKDFNLKNFNNAINYIIGVDTGHTKNAFAVVMQHYDVELKSAVLDLIVEVRPCDNVSVNFPNMFKEVIEPIINKVRVALVVFDKWQSINYEQELHEKGLNSIRYSLKTEDFSNIRSVLLNRKASIPNIEVSFDEIINTSKDYESFIDSKPITHFVYQILTVRDIGRTVTKGLGTDDDIFRAWCLGIKFLFDDKYKKIFQVINNNNKKNRSLGMSIGKSNGIYSLNRKCIKNNTNGIVLGSIFGHSTK